MDIKDSRTTDEETARFDDSMVKVETTETSQQLVGNEIPRVLLDSKMNPQLSLAISEVAVEPN